MLVVWSRAGPVSGGSPSVPGCTVHSSVPVFFQLHRVPLSKSQLSPPTAPVGCSNTVKSSKSDPNPLLRLTPNIITRSTKKVHRKKEQPSITFCKSQAVMDVQLKEHLHSPHSPVLRPRGENLCLPCCGASARGLVSNVRANIPIFCS